MGVPADLDELAGSGIVSAAGLAAARAGAEEAAGTSRPGTRRWSRYLGARLGPEVVDRLVDPLLGGVYAGRSDQLSFEATMPALAAATRDGQPVTAAAARLLDSAARGPAGSGPPAPVFMTLPGGLASLVPAVSAASARGRAHRRDGPGHRAVRARLAADRRVRARPVVCGGRRGRAGAARGPGRPAAGRACPAPPRPPPGWPR